MKLLDDARETLRHFTSVEYKFPNEQFKQLESHLSDDDRRMFHCRLDGVTVDEFRQKTYKSWACLRKYKLKENLDDLTKARQRMTL